MRERANHARYRPGQRGASTRASSSARTTRRARSPSGSGTRCSARPGGPRPRRASSGPSTSTASPGATRSPSARSRSPGVAPSPATRFRSPSTAPGCAPAGSPARRARGRTRSPGTSPTRAAVSPLLLLPRGLYDAPLPKAKALSGVAARRLQRPPPGVAGATWTSRGWVGSQNHNWGTQAHRPVRLGAGRRVRQPPGQLP